MDFQLNVNITKSNIFNNNSEQVDEDVSQI